MSDEAAREDAARRLRRMADDPLVPDHARSHACDLADRLGRGVRIFVLGPQGIGKSMLCDAIVAASQPSVQHARARLFTDDSADKPVLAFSDGVEVFPTAQFGLGHAQLIDVPVPQDPKRYMDLVAEALEEADVVLWCTEKFAESEVALWSRAPDALKDHSFLVLTQADRLADQGVLKERMSDLRSVVSEEFHSFFPVTTARLRQLQTSGKDVPEAQFAASGVKALIDALSSLVRSGQRVDLDSAILFLERHGVKRYDTSESAPAEKPEAAGTAKAAPAPMEPAAEPDRTTAPVPFEAARAKIMERAFDLAELGFDEADGDMSEVLNLCSSISEDLAEEMRSQAGASPEVAPWCDAFEAASDKIMLMTMENDTRSAADAVTILVQLRRDLDQLSFH